MILKRVSRFFKSIFFPEPPKPPFQHICQVGDPVLRMQAVEVSPEEIKSPHIQQVVKQLCICLRDYKTEGLAAPQIGLPLRIIAMESSAEIKEAMAPNTYAVREMCEFPLTVFINPVLKIVNYETAVFSEGCASILGFTGNVSRYKSVQLEGLTPEGEKIKHIFNGWLARIAQHEMDHLNGKLYLDRMNISTFQNEAWHRINIYSGRIQLKFDSGRRKFGMR